LVRATCWDLPEEEALLLGRLMRSAESESVIEQAWLVRSSRSGSGYRSRSWRAASVAARAGSPCRHETPVTVGARQSEGSDRIGPGYRSAAPEHTPDGVSMRCVCARQRRESSAATQTPRATLALRCDR